MSYYDYDCDEDSSDECYDDNLVKGENGCYAYASSGDRRVDLFFKLVRGAKDERISEAVNDIVMDGYSDELSDLIVMAFQTRDCRGGKGEKKIFYSLYLELFQSFPDTMETLLELVPRFGYYKDLILLAEEAQERELTYADKLTNRAVEIFANRLRDDKAELDASRLENRKPSMSMAGKFAPREGKQFKNFRTLLMNNLYAGLRNRHEMYRKLLSELSSALEVPEVLMAAQRFDEIDFAKVPSLCLNRNRKGFLNESGMLSMRDMFTGNRHREDEKRIACRQNLLNSARKNKVSGKVMMPHELVTQVTNCGTSEALLLNAQWSAMKEGVMSQLARCMLGNPMKPGSVNLGKLVPLVDVSSSMSGEPMEVAIALGILVSELTGPAFRDRFITFETNPKWVSLQGLSDLRAKVRHTRRASWGGSTDFSKALRLILKVAVKARLSPDEIPDLIVFSDMQFNSAGGLSQTMYFHIEQLFAEAGTEICGTPYPVPRIIFWNLFDSTGIPQFADAPNVQLLSGFSPNLLKLLLSGEPLVQEELNEKGVVVKRSITPYETLRRALDDERYDCIRNVLIESEEGALKAFLNWDESWPSLNEVRDWKH